VALVTPLPVTVTLGGVPAMDGRPLVLAATSEIAAEHRKEGRMALDPDQVRLLDLIGRVFPQARVVSLWVAP
jgi:hypothetical protein